MIQVDDCFYLGYVKRLNGKEGALEFVLDVDDPAKYRKKESVLLMMNRNLVPFFIEKFTPRQGGAVIKLKQVDTEAEATLFIGSEAYMPLKELPPLKGKKQFYFHEVIGYDVFDTAYGNIGVVKDIVDQTIQPVMAITHGEKEILVPLIDEFIVEVDKENRKFTLQTPEGLINMYLEIP